MPYGHRLGWSSCGEVTTTNDHMRPHPTPCTPHLGKRRHDRPGISRNIFRLGRDDAYVCTLHSGVWPRVPSFHISYLQSRVREEPARCLYIITKTLLGCALVATHPRLHSDRSFAVRSERSADVARGTAMTGAENAWSDVPMFRVLCVSIWRRSRINQRCMSPTARSHSFMESCYLLVCHVPKATRQVQRLKHGEDHALSCHALSRD